MASGRSGYWCMADYDFFIFPMSEIDEAFAHIMTLIGRKTPDNKGDV